MRGEAAGIVHGRRGGRTSDRRRWRHSRETRGEKSLRMNALSGGSSGGGVDGASGSRGHAPPIAKRHTVSRRQRRPSSFLSHFPLLPPAPPLPLILLLAFIIVRAAAFAFRSSYSSSFIHGMELETQTCRGNIYIYI